MKISSTLFRVLASKLPVILLGLFALMFVPQVSFSEIFVPVDEYIGYFDSNGIYTVVGNVKNEHNYAIIPTITISVKENSEIFSKTITHVPLGSGTKSSF